MEFLEYVTPMWLLTVAVSLGLGYGLGKLVIKGMERRRRN